MPTYEYVCTDCGGRTELRASIAEKRAVAAPRCATCDREGSMRRVFSAVATVGSRTPAGRPMGMGGGGCCGGACGCG